MCAQCRRRFARLLRACVTPVVDPRGRCVLQVHAQVLGNGTALCVSTAHLTAGKASAAIGRQELSSCLASLEKLKVDACVFAGDLNTQPAD